MEHATQALTQSAGAVRLRRPEAGTSPHVEKKCEYAQRKRQTGISSASMPILAVAILLLLEDGALVVAASAAIEGKRHQNHNQSPIRK